MGFKGGKAPLQARRLRAERVTLRMLAHNQKIHEVRSANLRKLFQVFSSARRSPFAIPPKTALAILV